jgi:hypothetical protein
MNTKAETFRLVVIRLTNGRTLETVVKQPLVPTICMPYLDYEHGGFGRIDYVLTDQRTVSGLPIYR